MTTATRHFEITDWLEERQGRFIVEGEVTLRLLFSGSARFAAESVLLAPERVLEL